MAIVFCNWRTSSKKGTLVCFVRTLCRWSREATSLAPGDAMRRVGGSDARGRRALGRKISLSDRRAAPFDYVLPSRARAREECGRRGDCILITLRTVSLDDLLS